jgi:peptidoglycan/xylan/chitin deacetylase (PgdA/CDA1 family)
MKKKILLIFVLIFIAASGVFLYVERCKVWACDDGMEYLAPSPSVSAKKSSLQTPPKLPQGEAAYSILKAGETIKFPVFNYHHLGPMPENADINRRAFTVTPELFEGHLKYFRDNGYQVVLVGELIEYFKTGKPLPEKAVAITFDDGYLEHYDNAFPLLKKYGVKATFFIPTGWVGTSTRGDMMSWAQIKQMSDAGMAIGSHAITHPNLQNISDEDLKRELEGSKKMIEEKIGISCDLLAYPGGNHDARVIEAVASAGYEGALSVYKIIAQAPKYIYSIRRFHADDNMESVVGKLTEADY